MSSVSIVSLNTPSGVKRAVRRATDLIRFQFASSLRTIVIKPDMCYYWDYSTGQTTDPRFVAGLVDYLREYVSADAEIVVAESDTASRKCEDVSKFLGYAKLAEAKGIRLANLSRETANEAHAQTSNRAFSFLLPTLLKKADLLIDVPKIKRSPIVEVACALQNLYGCNPDPSKPAHGFQTDDETVAFSKLVKPHLCLAEGLTVHGRNTAKLGCLLASIDPVAVDVVAARILGLNANKISHVHLACTEGLGTAEYRIVGDSVEDYVARFPRENARDRIWSNLSRLGLLAFNRLGRRADSYS